MLFIPRTFFSRFAFVAFFATFAWLWPFVSLVFGTYCISTNYFNFLFHFFFLLFSSMHCYRLLWKLAKRRDIVNFWHHREQWTTIHARRQPNSLKLHISAVHVSRLQTFIMIQKYNLYYVRLLLVYSVACMCICVYNVDEAIIFTFSIYFDIRHSVQTLAIFSLEFIQ